MSTVPYWLQKQRKPDLQELAAHVGLKKYVTLTQSQSTSSAGSPCLLQRLIFYPRRSYDKLLKTELEVALDDHLRTNQTRLQNDPLASAFYKRKESPVKRESGGATATSVVDEVKKPKQRRPTLKAREELGQP
ncbi:MAG: hypothetical protein Q9201_007320, partial [Fulgogasparrea decipioides]